MIRDSKLTILNSSENGVDTIYTIVYDNITNNVFFAGGFGGGSCLKQHPPQFGRYNISTNLTTNLTPSSWYNRGDGAVYSMDIDSNNRIIFLGISRGCSNSNVNNELWSYNITSNSFFMSVILF